MSFCIRNRIHYVSKGWHCQAVEALDSMLTATKAFNSNEPLGYCKARILHTKAIGLSTKAQMYLHIALSVSRRKDFESAIFKALESQKEFIEDL